MTVLAQKPERYINWPLRIGTAIVALLAFVAIFGPGLAPRDPLERTLVAEVDGVRQAAPFPPFSSTFPLGTDQFGRDTLSRLLWAVRPTLLLVLIVAVLRLLFGYLIGILAGWASGWVGRVANTFLATATSIPVLIVALAAITAVGIERGLPAFIVGMVLTGWADTAQQVRAQTNAVRVQLYIEAARAMGASSGQIVLRHILRHTLPLGGVLFAFEVSASLMLAAGLGFLGYYIGGGVWIITSGELIPVAQRAAGPPELGQMVATSLVRFTSRPPWQMIFPGLTIFLAILGFVFLGEGLRRRQQRLVPLPAGPVVRRLGRVGRGLEAGLFQLAGRWDRGASRALGGIVGVCMLAIGLGWWLNQPSAAADQPQVVNAVRQQGWASGRGDASGTLWSTSAPASETINWQFSDPTGFAGSPALASDGTVYVAATGGTLHALDGQGNSRWQRDLGHEPVGGPALASDGTIYVADREGGLSAVAPAGTINWRFQSPLRNEATGGPLVGPDGTIYYTIVDGVQAVTPAGTGRWAATDKELAVVEQAPRLSTNGEYIFLRTAVFRASDGALLRIPIVANEQAFNDPLYFVGADNFNYYRSGHEIIRWRQVETGLGLAAPLTWAHQGSVLFLPADVGVQPDGTVWLLYTASYADTRVVWINNANQVVGNTLFRLTNGKAIAAANDALYICGSAPNRALECRAQTPDSDEPRWRVTLEPLAIAVGGALVDGQLYITTDTGTLYALGATAGQ
jgi:peptide/nickel transport system permease protein